ncbi:MAG TPA: oligopeptide/dipeptide ABC transporter ATP-binding protein [Nitrososphaerales archaeon]|nr:oligopeptide/dipeptide ABC transporter ATP-binding protein [Nitrososphaerales archaeon]
MSRDLVLEVKGLTKKFPVKKGLVFKKTVGQVHAVTDVSFSVARNETVSLVGESGSGKTTIAKMVSGLLSPTSGDVLFEGKEMWKLKREELREVRKKIGIVFQDPFASLNPRMKIHEIIAEPLAIHHWKTKKERKERARELLVKVGLSRSDTGKYPHQFSGGQLQRIAIARALALDPLLIVADEPVSALDVSVQAKIMNLMYDLQKSLGISCLMISHDLGVVRHISNRVLILYLGHLMEEAPTEELYSRILHPYSQALFSSVLTPDVDSMKMNPPKLLSGEIPSPVNLPTGCKFNTRCPYVQENCKRNEPAAFTATGEHLVSCFYWKEIEEGQLDVTRKAQAEVRP